MSYYIICQALKESTDQKKPLAGKLMFLGKRRQGMIRNPTASGTRIPSMARNWSKKHLENLKRGLGATDVVKLANGFILFCVDDVHYAESLIFAYKSFKMAPHFITRVPMKNMKLRVVGTRMFCFSGNRDIDSVVVFDVWNPYSVNIDNDNVHFFERKNDMRPRKCCGLGSVPTPCIICSSSKGCLFICDECLNDEELGLRQ